MLLLDDFLEEKQFGIHDDVVLLTLLTLMVKVGQNVKGFFISSWNYRTKYYPYQNSYLGLAVLDKCRRYSRRGQRYQSVAHMYQMTIGSRGGS
jgi:hypothetical protein